MAVDTGGVLKYVLTEIWKTFYDECTVGASVKRFQS